MKMKLIENEDDPGTLQHPRKLVVVELPPLTGRQSFTDRRVAQGIMEGYITLSDNKLTLNTPDGPYEFYVIRTPGRYCCHCDGQFPGALAPAHVATEHPGVDSPDSRFPAGFADYQSYQCFEVARAKDYGDAVSKERELRRAKWRVISKHNRPRDLVPRKPGDLAAIRCDRFEAIKSDKEQKKFLRTRSKEGLEELIGQLSTRRSPMLEMARTYYGKKYLGETEASANG